MAAYQESGGDGVGRREVHCRETNHCTQGRPPGGQVGEGWAGAGHTVAVVLDEGGMGPRLLPLLGQVHKAPAERAQRPSEAHRDQELKQVRPEDLGAAQGVWEPRPAALPPRTHGLPAPAPRPRGQEQGGRSPRAGALTSSILSTVVLTR